MANLSLEVEKGELALGISIRALQLLTGSVEDSKEKKTFYLEYDGTTLKATLPLTSRQWATLFGVEFTDQVAEKEEKPEAPKKAPHRTRTDSVGRAKLLEAIGKVKNCEEAVDEIIASFHLDTEYTEGLREAFVETVNALCAGKDRVNYSNYFTEQQKVRLGEIFNEMFPAGGRRPLNSALLKMADAFVKSHPTTKEDSSEPMTTEEDGTTEIPPLSEQN